MNNETMTYDYSVVRQFAISTVVLGIVGMLVGGVNRITDGMAGA